MVVISNAKVYDREPCILSHGERMSIANWKEREKEQRRNDILDVAEKLFFSKGYDNVSMSGIAKKVGLGKATLYIYKVVFKFEHMF